MTDLEKVKHLFTELGLPFKQFPFKDTLIVSLQVESKSRKGDKIIGYTGFVAEYRFTPDGNFIELCIAE